MQSVERMTQLLIDYNERMTIRLAEIETESRREARATQMAIATLFSTKSRVLRSEWMNIIMDYIQGFMFRV